MPTTRISCLGPASASLRPRLTSRSSLLLWLRSLISAVSISEGFISCIWLNFCLQPISLTGERSTHSSKNSNKETRK